MDKLSRRAVMAGLITGLSSVMGRSAKAAALPRSASPLQAPMSATARKQAVDSLVDYFARNAPLLLRPTEGLLKYPSIAPSLPGKQYSTSLWDWDTHWTSRGLFRLARVTGDKALQAKVGEHARGSLLNFLASQSEEGRLPIMISTTERDPFGCLKKASPNVKNQAKPVFGQLALLIADETGDAEWLRPHFEHLLRFYRSWVLGNQSAMGLFVWGNDVAIGNDNDPTTYGRPPFSSANLLLNCLFYADLQAAAELAGRLNRTDDRDRLAEQAKALGAQILRSCWDPRDRFFYTVDVQCVDRRAEYIPGFKPGMDMAWQSLPMRFQVFTGFLPMWCGLATKQQAAELVQANYLADQRFRGDWGVRSLSSLETMYTMAFSSNPSNWLGPVWIIVNYFVWKGLKQYGFQAEAAELADKTIRLLSADLAANGSLNEYYHPDTGAALSHKGFMDWDLLVLEMIPG